MRAAGRALADRDRRRRGISSRRAVILATGAALKELGVPGEERLRGKGVSHCASCDAPLLRDKHRGRRGRRRFRGAGSADPGGVRVARVIILHRGDALSAQAAYRDRVLRIRGSRSAATPWSRRCSARRASTGVRTRERRRSRSGPGGRVRLYWPAAEYRLSWTAASRSIRRDGSRPTARCGPTLAGICAAGAVRAGWLGRAAISAGEGAAAAIAVDRYLRTSDWREGEERRMADP